jgi:hypothetical protein
MLHAMKRAVLVLALLAACKANGDDGGFPLGPGQGVPSTPNPGTTPVDGGASDAFFDSGVAVTGRVCVLTDLRLIGLTTGCQATGLAGMNVIAGVRQTTTRDDGSFTINAPESSAFTWQVTSPATGTTLKLIPSLTPATLGTNPVLPAVSDVVYNDLLNANGLSVNAEQTGSVFVRVLKDSAPIAKVTATSTPAAPQLAFYDSDTSATDWKQSGGTGTGTHAVVWLAGLQLPQKGGSASVSVTLTLPAPQPAGTQPTVVSTTVTDQSITFLTADIE